MSKGLWLLALCAVAAVAAPPPPPRCVRGPYLQNAAVGSIELHWELDRPATCAVDLAAEGGPRQWVQDHGTGRRHRVRLGGLRPGAMYRYRVWSGPAAVSDEHRFRVTPLGGHRFTFAVFGDSGAGTRGQMQVADLLARSPAEFVLLPGDIVYGRGEEERYNARFFAPYRASLPRMTFWPALGNHDIGTRNGGPALSVFSVPANGPRGVQPERNYSFDYGNVHVAAFDSNAPTEVLRETIGPWLQRDLEQSRRTWKIVFMHHPPFSSGQHGETPKIRDVMVPFIARARADLVFSGHDHAYERTKPRDGVTYIVSGNGGARLYPRRSHHDYTAVFYNQRHGLTLVTVDGHSLSLRHVNVEGQEIDRLELRKVGVPRQRHRWPHHPGGFRPRPPT